MKNIKALIDTAESVTVFIDNRSHTVRKTESNYPAVANAIALDNEQALRVALGTATAVVAYSQGRVEIVDEEVLLDGQPLHNAIARKILELMKGGKKFEYLTNFLERVSLNPSEVAREELYLFLEHGNIPITPDGYFLAYRKVDDNYMSYHANPDGTHNRNKVGDVCTYDRELVDPVRNNTCSTGLHFCSFSYLRSYYGGAGRVMIVRIDPADVVTIPSDYSNSKGRCCKYTVVAEHVEKESSDRFVGVPIVNSDASEHTEFDADFSYVLPEPKKRMTTFQKRIDAYIRKKFDKGQRPTLRQVQSIFSPKTPDLKGLKRSIQTLGYTVIDDAKFSASVVTVT